MGSVPAGLVKGEKAALDPELEKLLKGIDHAELREVLEGVFRRDGAEPEFMEAVHGVAASLVPVMHRRPECLRAFCVLCEPERQVLFRVPWCDDGGAWHVNRGMRVQFCSALGPCKGGLRFHPSLTLSVIKFLGFEQIFKNSLTTLPLGGAKGGADFDPKGRSDAEIMRFCQSFMTELQRHIGPDTDVPAGDMGVTAREIGYMYGQYRRIRGASAAVMTGKGPAWGGSALRPEATGYGAVFFAEHVLGDGGDCLRGKRCLVSGAGNVARHCVEMLLQRGAVVLTMSDSKGTIYARDGISQDVLSKVKEIKSKHDGRLEQLTEESVEYRGDRATPWHAAADAGAFAAFPCATQGELDQRAARALAEAGVKLVVEGANMPCTPEAKLCFAERGVTFAPGKAANAGGVAVSGLEMAQNRQLLPWTRQQVEDKLREIMHDIYRNVKTTAEEYDTDLAGGANIAGFLKVADAILAQGTA